MFSVKHFCNNSFRVSVRMWFCMCCKLFSCCFENVFTVFEFGLHLKVPIWYKLSKSFEVESWWEPHLVIEGLLHSIYVGYIKVFVLVISIVSDARGFKTWSLCWPLVICVLISMVGACCSVLYKIIMPCVIDVCVIIFSPLL